MKLKEFFEDHPKVALAFSGGVDSAYLLYEALQTGADIRAYYVKSDFQPEFEYQDAFRLAKDLGVNMTTLKVDVLGKNEISENSLERCYHCKKLILSSIIEKAKIDGYEILIDGTNASDEEGDRPGMKALKELEVLSPLRLCGITKKEVRRLSREAGLFTWNKPAYACLATRIPSGMPITKEKMEITEKAEDYLFSLGFKDFRVRFLGNKAKLEIRESQLKRLFQYRKEILNELKKYYSEVLLDLEVRLED